MHASLQRAVSARPRVLILTLNDWSVLEQSLQSDWRSPEPCALQPLSELRDNCFDRDWKLWPRKVTCAPASSQAGI